MGHCSVPNIANRAHILEADQSKPNVVGRGLQDAARNPHAKILTLFQYWSESLDPVSR